MSTRKRKRYEAKFRGQWEYRFAIGARPVIYLGGSRRFNRATERMFEGFHQGRACPAFKPLIHNGRKPS